MTDEFFFITFAGLGVSLAGFAGLIHALDRSDVENPVTRWRIRSIVTAGFSIAGSGLMVWPVYRITTDVDVTVRIVSALLLTQLLRLTWADIQPGPAWEGAEARWRVMVAIAAVLMILTASNVFIGSVGILEVLFVLVLGQPMGTFIRAVDDLNRSSDNGFEQNDA